MTPDRARAIEARLAPLCGLRPWKVELGHGSFVTLDFGEARTRDGSTRGAWHFWVYCCAWRLDDGDTVVAGSGDDRVGLAPKIAALTNRRLDKIDVAAPAGQTVLRFEGDTTLTLFPMATESEDYQVYMPDGEVLVVGPAGAWHEETS